MNEGCQDFPSSTWPLERIRALRVFCLGLPILPPFASDLKLRTPKGGGPHESAAVHVEHDLEGCAVLDVEAGSKRSTMESAIDRLVDRVRWICLVGHHPM